jgi:hypothetical protein
MIFQANAKDQRAQTQQRRDNDAGDQARSTTSSLMAELPLRWTVIVRNLFLEATPFRAAPFGSPFHATDADYRPHPGLCRDNHFPAAL